MKEYIRDKRSPRPLRESISKVMSANKAKNTKPELLVRRALWENGVRGYRLNWKKAPGRPDIAFPGREIAIFINGCYWHRCPKCNLSLPKSNIEFWKEKFERNIARDKRKNEELLDLGWNVLVLWECDIKSNILKIVYKINKILNAKEK